MKKKSKNILVIRFSSIGDVAMTAIVIRTLVSQNPSVKITVLSKNFLKPIFDNITNVSFYGVDTEKKHKGIIGIYKLYRELKSFKFDYIADLHNVIRSRVLNFFFTGTKIITINKGRPGKKALTRSKKKIFKQLKTTHERYADVFRKLGFELDLSKSTFPNPQKMPNEIKAFIGTKKLKLIGISPFAKYKSKTYPLDLMEIVLQKLSKKENLKILLFGGGKKEIELLEKFEKKFSNTLCIAGKLTLKEELNIISNLNCMVSMDSGNAHFSALFGIPTITLWGTTHPYAGFAPFNQPKKHFLIPDIKKYPKIPCSIYGNKVCKGYENVMKTIHPSVVVNSILKYSS